MQLTAFSIYFRIKNAVCCILFGCSSLNVSYTLSVAEPHALNLHADSPFKKRESMI